MGETIVEQVVLRRLYDMHVHLRTGYLLSEVLLFTAKYCAFAVAMPNTRPRAILTGEDVVWYQDEIKKVIDWMHGLPQQCKKTPPFFQPLMTIEIRDTTTPKMIEDAKKAGAIAGKIYPLGVTTNSDEGLRNFFCDGVSDVFKAMKDVGMLLLLHGELDSPRTLFTKREASFLSIILPKLVERNPELKIVLEHVSTKKGVEAVKQFSKNVAATITAHHPLLTLNDARLQPHNICNPTPNDFDDRDALVEAMTSGNPKFFLGSDSAPHPREKKEGRDIACGNFTAPILPQILTGIFEQAGKLGRTEDFTSRFPAEFYGLPLVEETITLKKQEWTVPEQFGYIVSFLAGKKLHWQLV